MSRFTIGSPAQVTVPFHDYQGDVVTPTALSYEVTDGEGNHIVGPTPITDLSGGTTIIDIPAEAHDGPGGYTVTLTISVGANTFIAEEIYTMVAVQRLAPPQNTFQTYAEAAYAADTVPNLISWLNAEREERITALTEAFRRITRLNFIIPAEEFPADQSRIMDSFAAGGSRLTPRMWSLMTPELFADYPEAFRKALKLAQVVEANQILTADPYATRRAAGLMSESIGESSMMFKGGVRPLEFAVARATLECLTGYVSHRMTLSRT